MRFLTVFVIGLSIAIGYAYDCSRAGTPGIRIGDTYYDQQHFGSTGRQVDQSPVYQGSHGVMQAIWTRGVEPSAVLGKSVHWNSVAIDGSPTPLELDNGDTIRILPLAAPAYVDGLYTEAEGEVPSLLNLRSLASGRAVAALQDGVGTPDRWFVWVDSAVQTGVFASGLGPQPLGGDDVVYPKLTVDVVGVDTVIHVVATERGTTLPQQVYYTRGVLSGNLIAWSTPVLIDTVQQLSAVIEASPVSDDVAVVYTQPRPGAVDYHDNELAYRMSTDGGVTWGLPTTAISLGGANRVSGDLSAAFDDDNTLHVLFCTVRFSGYARFPVGHVLHWNNLRLTRRSVTFSAFWNTCSVVDSLKGGAWDTEVSKPSLIVKPAGAGPGSGIADELLYAVWVQFGPTATDCASLDSAGAPGGYVNAELWSSVSSDDGLTWDWPRNITGTETPDCLPGDCHSEHWVSAAARADSGIYLTYVDDAHAGAAVSGEGAWTLNNFTAYALEARLPRESPRVYFSFFGSQPQITLPPNRMLYPTAFTDRVDSQQIRIQNIGNAELSFTVEVMPDDGGLDYMSIDGGTSVSGTIPAAGGYFRVFRYWTGIGLTEGETRHWRLRVVSNDPVEDTIHFHLETAVMDPEVSIAGYKYEDADGDGFRDQGEEPGLAGWTIRVEPGGYSTVTDVNGFYRLSGLPEGTYMVSEEPRTGWLQTQPGDSGTWSVHLWPGVDTIGFDFGNRFRILGDCTDDGIVSTADIVFMVNCVFKAGPPPVPAEVGDVNCTGEMSSSDIILTVNYVLKGGPPPSCY